MAEQFLPKHVESGAIKALLDAICRGDYISKHSELTAEYRSLQRLAGRYHDMDKAYTYAMAARIVSPLDPELYENLVQKCETAYEDFKRRYHSIKAVHQSLRYH